MRGSWLLISALLTGCVSANVCEPVEVIKPIYASRPIPAWLQEDITIEGDIFLPPGGDAFACVTKDGADRLVSLRQELTRQRAACRELLR